MKLKLDSLRLAQIFWTCRKVRIFLYVRSSRVEADNQESGETKELVTIKFAAPSDIPYQNRPFSLQNTLIFIIITASTFTQFQWGKNWFRLQQQLFRPIDLKRYVFKTVDLIWRSNIKCEERQMTVIKIRFSRCGYLWVGRLLHAPQLSSRNKQRPYIHVILRSLEQLSIF